MSKLYKSVRSRQVMAIRVSSRKKINGFAIRVLANQVNVELVVGNLKKKQLIYLSIVILYPV